MGKGGIHNMGVRYSEHELPHRNPGQESCLALQPFVGRALEFEQSTQFLGITSQTPEDRLLTVCRRNQAVGVVLKQMGDAREQLIVHRDARRGVVSPSTSRAHRHGSWRRGESLRRTWDSYWEAEPSGRQVSCCKE